MSGQRTLSTFSQHYFSISIYAAINHHGHHGITSSLGGLLVLRLFTEWIEFQFSTPWKNIVSLERFPLDPTSWIQISEVIPNGHPLISPRKNWLFSIAFCATSLFWQRTAFLEFGLYLQGPPPCRCKPALIRISKCISCFSERGKKAHRYGWDGYHSKGPSP